MDYSPYSKKLDSNIKKWCKKYNIPCNIVEDMLLITIKSKKSLKPTKHVPYIVFTPFLKNLKNIK